MYGCGGGNSSTSTGSPLRVAVMMPLSGSDYLGYKLPLDWALQNINSVGIAGKKLELVYLDLAKEDLTEATRRLIEDDSILAVIGPDTSSKVYAVAPAFVQEQKVMITPTATSADIFRAFSQYKYIWRTVEPDISQVRTELTIAARDGAKKVALITSTDEYGSTFFDWFGFFATELGLDITEIVRYSDIESCSQGMDKILAQNPDVLIAVPTIPEITIEIAQKWKASGNGIRLIFSDAAQSSYLIQTLGKEAEGLEGTSPAADKDSGFLEAFEQYFQTPPTPYAANVYDSLTLVAYGLERSNGVGGIKLADAIIEIVDSRGKKTTWDSEGVAEALKMIHSGKLPDISGATGLLEYDKDLHMDMTSSTYGHWQVENGEFRVLEYISTGDSLTAINGKSAYQALVTAKGAIGISNGKDYQPGAKTGLWALIVATSSGWDNYRHQADALAQYRLLRSDGVPDDRIILVLADDIANNQSNIEPGVVRNTIKGEDLYTNVQVDYNLSQITAGKLLAILAGQKSAELPSVIESSSGDDIFVFIVGHGNANGVYLGLNGAVPVTNAGVSILRPADLAQTVSSMFAQHQYRRMFIAVESCQGGVMGTELDTPGVLLLSGANAFEDSLSTNYDSLQHIWLADNFAYQLHQIEALTPGISVNDLYKSLYMSMNGSHVSAYAPAFGSTDNVKIEEFITP
jgi:glycosylphosphatidylinositol transamidase (GPIT) subunit GPI8/ABC-type branched-subunit amino acid transport system substrate-binding protein